MSFKSGVKDRGSDIMMVRAKVVTVMRWYAQDEVNQEEIEQNEVDGMKKGADSTDEVMHIVQTRLCKAYSLTENPDG